MQIKFSSPFGEGQVVELEVPEGTTVKEIVERQIGSNPSTKVTIRLTAPDGSRRTVDAEEAARTTVQDGSRIGVAPANVAGA